MLTSRRKFIELAASCGASLVWRSPYARASKIQWRERRDLYPQGVASGDPYPDSVILWTRRPPAADGEARKLAVEIAEPMFQRVVATTTAALSAEADWTCRVLAAGLKPRQVYWYRFTDEHGFGSRVGRTMTTPSERDSRPVSFAFVSCQNVQAGASNAYRRMIWEDERKSKDDQLGFVLHLGDFVDEVVWYPEDRPQGYYARRLRSEPVMHRTEAASFQPQQFPFVLSENVVELLDGGQAYNNGRPPDTIRFNGADLPNPRRHAPPQSILGVSQKAWFLQKLRGSSASWKLWGNSVGMLDWRIDFQNMPEDVGPKWPCAGYALFSDDDWSAYRHERAEILNFIRSERITGVATICGDRHAFEAGLVSPSLPPKPFEPVIAEFVTGSISAPGLFEAAEYVLPKNDPLRTIYLYESSTAGSLQPAINVSIMHGVRASLALQRTGDARRALTERNPDVAPHLSFVDVGGHGYSLVRAGSEADSLRAAHTRSLLCVPFVVFENTLGAVYVDTADAEIGFDENHLQLLTAIASIASIAIENARRVEWLESENERLRAAMAIDHNMIGEGASMRALQSIVGRVAPTDSTVLILG